MGVHVQPQIIKRCFYLFGTNFAGVNSRFLMSSCKWNNIFFNGYRMVMDSIWVILMCSVYDDFDLITEPQISHINFASSWTSMCFFNPCLSKNRFGHFGQATGFVGVWRLACSRRSVGLLKLLPHVAHKWARTENEKGFVKGVFLDQSNK